MSSRVVTLLDGATWTASAQGSPIPVPTISMAEVVVSLGTTSGTFTACDVWLEGSADGTIWYEIPADLVMQKAGDAAQNSVSANQRNIMSGTAPASGDIHVARFQHLPAPQVRLAGRISGSTPSTVITAKLVGK
jgi:hypothetical protein